MEAGREDKFNMKKIILYSVFSFFFSLAVFFSIKMPTEFKKIFWTGISLADLFLFGMIFLISLLVVPLLNRGIDWINSRYKSEKVVTRIPAGGTFYRHFLCMDAVFSCVLSRKYISRFFLIHISVIKSYYVNSASGVIYLIGKSNS